MSQKFVIEGRLPSLNEYINAERTNRYLAAKMKRKWQDYIVVSIRRAKIRKTDKPVVLVYEHYAPDKRRDRDNIASVVHKFTQDALVSSGIIKDDGWDRVLNSYDYWHINRKNPRIEITIEEDR